MGTVGVSSRHVERLSTGQVEELDEVFALDDEPEVLEELPDDESPDDDEPPDVEELPDEEALSLDPPSFEPLSFFAPSFLPPLSRESVR